MKASCNREHLLAALQVVGTIAPQRSPKPILQAVKLVFAADGAVALATDLEVGVRYRVDGVRVEEPGEVLLPAVRATSILRELSDQELYLEATATHVLIRGAHSEFKLPAEDPAGFPAIPEFSEAGYWTVPSGALREMIRRTIFATDVESSRYALNGLLLELEPKRLGLVGTDGRRLALMRRPAKTVGNPESSTPGPVAPAKAMSLIDKSLQPGDDEVALAVRQNDLLAKSARALVCGRLLEGRFPKYQDVFPDRVEIRVDLTVGPFLAALRQAAIVTSDESRGVTLKFSQGTLRLDAQAADVGQSRVELPISYDGKPLEAAFDPRYLIDMLRVLGEEAAVTAEFVDGDSAAVFRTTDGYAYVVMPLTKER